MGNKTYAWITELVQWRHENLVFSHKEKDKEGKIKRWFGEGSR